MKERGGVVGDWSDPIDDVLDGRWTKVKGMGPVTKVRVDLAADAGCEGSVFVCYADPVPKTCAVIADDRKISVPMSTDAEEKLAKVVLPQTASGVSALVFNF